MRVAMYYNNIDVRLEEMHLPRVGSGEILVKVMASGICGSDVMEWYRIKKAPLVLGHEITGEIVKIGKGVNQYKIGDRVFVSHHVPCNECYYCLKGYHTVCDTLRSTNFEPGGFAEYVRVPKINVKWGTFSLPKEISFEDGTFIEPLGCVIRGMRLAKFQPGSSVVILGSGISGLLNILLARARGASPVITTDINAFRLKTAKNLGADVAIHGEEDIPKYIRETNDGRLADLVIVSTGAISTFTQAFKCVERGGTVLFFAPPEPGFNLLLPAYEFWRDQITLVSTYAASPMDITEAIKLISTRKVPVHNLITHRLGLGETNQGFQLVTKADESIKVIIEPFR